MALNPCEEVIGNYLSQLRVGFESSPSEDGCFLSTPFTRPDGEGIEIELQVLPGGRISMSDMGDTLGYLYVNGLTLSRPLITAARQISKSHGVSLQSNHLNVQVDPDSIGNGLHGLIQAMLSVTDLIQKRRPTSRVRFDDEVESMIIHSGVVYDVGFKVRGVRERHTVKFHVNSGKNLLIHPVSAAQQAIARSWAERLAYRFSDILMESPQWKPVAVLDDRNTRAAIWDSNAITPVQEYVIYWSDRSELQSRLTAAYSE